MAEVTEFGKFLRKMRIDRSERLGDMAGKLGVSSAYLSSIENGAREIPEDFVAKIAAEYGLDEAQTNELEEAKAKARGTVDVKFSEQRSQADYVETAVMFARDFSRLNAEQVKKIKALLKEFEGSGDYRNGSNGI